MMLEYMAIKAKMQAVEFQEQREKRAIKGL